MSSNFSSTINFSELVLASKASNKDLRLCLQSMDFQVYDPLNSAG
jgi:hypothetical protein